MSRNLQLLEQLNRERLRDSTEVRPERDLTPPPIPKRKRGTRSYEELNKLVQGVFLSNPTPARQVVFTGASPGVGCTWICAHAAEVLCSQTTRDVCLVDTNASSPGISGYFNIPNDAGFFDALADHGSVDSFTRKVASNLWVMTAGDDPGGDTVFSPERFETLRFNLGREFEFVLFDAAPAAPHSSGLRVASLADGAVLVLKAGHTPRRAVGLALKELGTAHARVLGTVLNQRDYPVPEAIYQRL